MTTVARGSRTTNALQTESTLLRCRRAVAQRSEVGVACPELVRTWPATALTAHSESRCLALHAGTWPLSTGLATCGSWHRWFRGSHRRESWHRYRGGCCRHCRWGCPRRCRRRRREGRGEEGYRDGPRVTCPVTAPVGCATLRRCAVCDVSMTTFSCVQACQRAAMRMWRGSKQPPAVPRSGTRVDDRQ